MLKQDKNCRICGTAITESPVSLNETMFGSLEPFTYVRCASCDTLQIESIPDMERHYPAGYYSLSSSRPSLRARIRRFLKPPALPEWMAQLPKNATILDMGCGSGDNLVQMHSFGFKRLSGYDPFLSGPATLRGGIRLHTSVPSGPFGVVMMHHSLEHMPDPVAALLQASALLEPEGRLVIRIPVRQGAPWREYGWDWVHLDPPRHLYLWTVSGFTNMANTAGFEVLRSGFDTSAFSFAGSELRRKKLPINPHLGEYPAEQIQMWQDRAERLNEAGDGDSAWFLLSKSTAQASAASAPA